ncbi:hypothetical protein AB0I16_23255 [Streptomyces sp. NPDC050703]|uniref:hypothetical protein n=1 Tax=Streptomyces sp. NPDC050703 TaxID=3157218 RepID=UPI00342A9A65
MTAKTPCGLLPSSYCGTKTRFPRVPLRSKQWPALITTSLPGLLTTVPPQKRPAPVPSSQKNVPTIGSPSKGVPGDPGGRSGAAARSTTGRAARMRSGVQWAAATAAGDGPLSARPVTPATRSSAAAPSAACDDRMAIPSRLCRWTVGDTPRLAWPHPYGP